MSDIRKYLAEAMGTMVLVLLGCGAAVIAWPEVLGGTLGIAFAFWLSVIAMAYTIGHISGCHINPAITIGAWTAWRMRTIDMVMYIIFQIIGGLLGACILFYISSNGSWSLGEWNMLGANMIHTVGNSTLYYTQTVAFVVELLMTFIFVRVVLGSTSPSAPGKLAGLAIGLTLVLIHIVTIPITGTSVNPARSIGPAFFVQWTAIAQLWIFILAPILGWLFAGLVYRYGCEGYTWSCCDRWSCKCAHDTLPLYDHHEKGSMKEEIRMRETGKKNSSTIDRWNE